MWFWVRPTTSLWVLYAPTGKPKEAGARRTSAPPRLSPAQVRFSWHWSVNRCEQVYRDLACQGWHCLWPSVTRDGNCHLLQAAHQNTLLPGTSIGSNQLVSGHHAIPADGQRGWGAAKAAPSWRCMKWRRCGFDFQLRLC